MADDFAPDAEDDFAPDASPVEPAGKVPSPTGWADPSKPSLMGNTGDLNALQRDMERQQTNMWGALASGAHGAANAMEGPVNGAIAALKKSVPMPGDAAPSSWDDLVKADYGEKNRIEGAQKQNLKDFPRAPIVGAVLTGGAGSAPSAAGRLAMSGIQGASYGLGSSEHDLGGEKADPAGVAKDTGIGAGVGLAGGALGEGINAAAGAVGNKLSKVIQSGDDAAKLAAEKAFNSARGAFGGDVSAGSGQLKMLRDALTNPNADPALKRAAEEFLASPEGATLLNQVLRSNIGRAEGQVGRIAASQATMGEKAAAMAPEVTEAVSAARRNDSSALTRRLRDIVPKLALPALGGALAGPPGAAAGALGAAVLGRSGTTVRNMMADPYVSSRILGAGTTALSGAGNAMSHAAPPLAEWSRFLKEEDHGDE